ncbi:tyrosine-type recombinase/integrase [Aeromonas encheleia]|uniref:tyrosine-type recombinase/integrase n=1 Tax=Aeromonas encheleia TaxID=73010 RepID=UPI001F57B508|nr:tyrosine-type recombinase/integrase [Aeromonas encheleia]UNP90273.1 tyrosine-type recombinase/integrase [Aeromonas encheleia]
MNLWLSPQGIWYYRKVTMLPCGRRKDIKKSLRARDKLAVRENVAQLLACARSRVKPEAVQPEPQSSSSPEPQQLPQQTPSAANLAPQTAASASSPVLSELSKRYLKEKTLSWAPKELNNQKNYIGYFIKALGDSWCLNIRDNRPDQKLKTANSARLIPIHSSLIAGGFIDFVQERAGGRLFPELPHRQDGYSHLWGQWFSRHRPVDKDFHSLRHTVATALKDHGVPLQYAAAILGHTNGAISYDRYGGGVAVEKLQAAIEAAL